MSKKTCILTIKNKYLNLTNVEKKIADYVLANTESVLSMSTGDLATHIPVAKSAVVRFCKTIGFTGYSEFKIALAMELSKNKQLNYVPYIHPEDTSANILEKIFSANVKTLHDTLEKLDRGMLQKAVDSLHNAKNIYIYGIGTSSGIANDFQYRLIQLGYTAFCFTDVPSMKISTMNIKEGDVAIGISNSGRTVATIEALKLAAENGAETICLTSFADSPITKSSHYPIVIFSDEIQYPIEAISARIAHISVLDTLAISLSALHYEETIARSARTRQLINTVRYEV